MGRHTKYYDVLGLSPGCSDNDIKKAYKKLALKYHPDKNRNDVANAERMFKSVSEAYNALRDPDQRRVYDLYGEDGLSGNAPGGSGAGVHFQHVDPSELFAQFFGSGFFSSMDDGMGDPFQQHRRHNSHHVDQHNANLQRQTSGFGGGFNDPFFSHNMMGMNPGFGSFGSFGNMGMMGGGGGSFTSMSSSSSFGGGGGGMSYSKSQSSYRDHTGRVVTKTVEERNGVKTETETIDPRGEQIH